MCVCAFWRNIDIFWPGAYQANLWWKILREENWFIYCREYKCWCCSIRCLSFWLEFDVVCLQLETRYRHKKEITSWEYCKALYVLHAQTHIIFSTPNVRLYSSVRPIDIHHQIYMEDYHPSLHFIKLFPLEISLNRLINMLGLSKFAWIKYYTIAQKMIELLVRDGSFHHPWFAILPLFLTMKYSLYKSNFPEKDIFMQKPWSFPISTLN